MHMQSYKLFKFFTIVQMYDDVKFRLSQINLFREENKLFGKQGRVPQTRKETKWHGHKHGRIFAGVRENK